MKSEILINGDCLDVMNDIEDNYIDLVLCDPPYGTTACRWDSVIDLDEMWLQLKRVAKPNAVFVMTCSQPFTTMLGMSNLKDLKYSLVWEKKSATGHLNAKIMPMKKHEDILVFSRGKGVYNPQGIKKLNKIVKRGSNGSCYGESENEFMQENTNYPRSILKFSKDSSMIHPTQKPVALMEYLIKTYSNKRDIVLDFAMGSGTTGIAAINTDRKFIGIELDSEYFGNSKSRIETHSKIINKQRDENDT